MAVSSIASSTCGAQRFTVGTPRVACRPFQSHRRCKSRQSQITYAAQTESFGDNVKRIAKKIQGSLPIIGLISRLTAPEGGFDELSYAEFSRSLYETSGSEFMYAMEDIENAHGKAANARWVLLMLWMSKCGPGFVGAKDVINAARRLRITQDMEIEIDRFENARDATLQKYQMLDRPSGTLQDQLDLAVDSVATCSIGLKDGEPLTESDAALLRTLLKAVFPEASEQQLQAAFDGRKERVYGYA